MSSLVNLQQLQDNEQFPPCSGSIWCLFMGAECAAEAPASQGTMSAILPEHGGDVSDPPAASTGLISSHTSERFTPNAPCGENHIN